MHIKTILGWLHKKIKAVIVNNGFVIILAFVHQLLLVFGGVPEMTGNPQYRRHY